MNRYNFPYTDTQKNTYQNIGEVFLHCKHLKKKDVSRYILLNFPEFWFYDEKVGEYLEAYSLSKEVGSPAFEGSIQDYPCNYLDFIKILTEEREFESKEKN